MYVLDTHALMLYWFQTWALPRLARSILEQGEQYMTELVVPTMALTEALRLVRQYSRGATTIPEFLDEVQARDYIRIEPMGIEHVRLLPQLEGIRELHDRIIASHAVALDGILLTPDQNIRGSGLVECAW